MAEQPKTPRDDAQAGDDDNDVEGHGQGLLPGLPGTGGDSLLPGLPGTGGDSMIRRPSGGGEFRTDDEVEGQPPLT
jgi:hypothetical protein